jgi:hypothetical protein
MMIKRRKRSGNLREEMYGNLRPAAGTLRSATGRGALLGLPALPRCVCAIVMSRTELP